MFDSICRDVSKRRTCRKEGQAIRFLLHFYALSNIVHQKTSEKPESGDAVQYYDLWRNSMADSRRLDLSKMFLLRQTQQVNVAELEEKE